MLGMTKVEFLHSSEWRESDWSRRWNPGGVALILHQGEKVGRNFGVEASLEQACPTRGPWAVCGQFGEFLRPN
ncbi:hypothetical protein TNCV_4531041 [Trichonephila clavipes]|nr:hypothetical protein TNCV_4531041 [Trichonephila clavipes]